MRKQQIETGAQYTIRLAGMSIAAGGYGPIALVKAQDAVMRFVPVDHPVEADVLVQRLSETPTVRWRVTRADGIVRTFGPPAYPEKISAVTRPIPHIPLELTESLADDPQSIPADRNSDFYEEACRVCGAKIPRSGKRGRPPTKCELHR